MDAVRAETTLAAAEAKAGQAVGTAVRWFGDLAAVERPGQVGEGASRLARWHVAQGLGLVGLRGGGAARMRSAAGHLP